jgi:prophage antirepressor-like protein
MEQIFKYNDVQVRTVYDETGEAWFVGIDVCKILGYADSHRKVKSLDEDEYRLDRLTDGQGKQKETLTVSESGLYSLILTSTKPEAKAFKRWVTHDVLPSIRRGGLYTTDMVKAKLTQLQEVNISRAEKKIEFEKAKIQMKQLKQEIEDLDRLFWELFGTDPAQLKLFSPEQMDAMKELKEVQNG